MTKREDEMLQRIHSVEEQLVKAAIMITEARERAEAAEKERDRLAAVLDETIRKAEEWGWCGYGKEICGPQIASSIRAALEAKP